MAESAIRVPDGLTTNGVIARRYFARLIDSVFIGILVFLVFRFIGTLVISLGGRPTSILIGLLLLVALWVGYGTALESSPWQATLGKRVMGLRVYTAQGGRLAPLQAASRNLVKDGPFLVLGFIPGGQLLAFAWLCAHLVVLHRSPVYQAIHDRVAHTWVAAPESTIQLRLS